MGIKYLQDKLAVALQSPNNKKRLKLISSLLDKTVDLSHREGLANCAVSVMSPEVAFWQIFGLVSRAGLSIETKEDLISQVRDVKQRLRSKGSKKSKILVVGILSQQGGVGRTTLALALSQYLAKTRRVCLVELDFANPAFYRFFPKISNFFNQPREKWADKPDNLPKLTDNLHIWPASPYWPDMIRSTMSSSPCSIEMVYQELQFKRLTKALANQFDAVVFDTPAGIKGISRALCGFLSQNGGSTLFVGDVAVHSVSPLIEHAWRLLVPASCALLLNCRSEETSEIHVNKFSSWLLKGKPFMFGMPIVSQELLRCLTKCFGGGMKRTYLIRDLARAERHLDTTMVLQTLNSADFNFSFLEN